MGLIDPPPKKLNAPSRWITSTVLCSAFQRWMSLMVAEPVVLPSGNRYELSSLALWVSEHGSEPLTRLPYDFSIPLTIDEDMKCTAHCTEMSWRSHSCVLQG